MIKEISLFIPLALVYMAFKSTLFTNVPLPDLPLLMVFYLAFRSSSVEGVIFAFVLGYMEDVLGGGIIGSTSFALIIVFMAVHLTGKRLHFTTVSTMAGGAALAVLVKGALIYLVVGLVGFKAALFTDVILQAVVTGVCAHSIIRLMYKLSSRIARSSFKGDVS